MATIAGRTATTRSCTLEPSGTTVTVEAPAESDESDLGELSAGVVTAASLADAGEESPSSSLISTAPPATSAETTTPVTTPPAKRQPGRRPRGCSLPLGAGVGGGPGGAGGRCAGGSAGASAGAWGEVIRSVIAGGVLAGSGGGGSRCVGSSWIVLFMRAPLGA